MTSWEAGEASEADGGRGLTALSQACALILRCTVGMDDASAQWADFERECWRAASGSATQAPGHPACSDQPSWRQISLSRGRRDRREGDRDGGAAGGSVHVERFSRSNE